MRGRGLRLAPLLLLQEGRPEQEGDKNARPSVEELIVLASVDFDAPCSTGDAPRTDFAELDLTKPAAGFNFRVGRAPAGAVGGDPFHAATSSV